MQKQKKIVLTKINLTNNFFKKFSARKRPIPLNKNKAYSSHSRSSSSGASRQSISP